MSTYKFLIVDETEKKNLLSEMKSDFDVKKIVRINHQTMKIDDFPQTDWGAFYDGHSYLFREMKSMSSNSIFALYFFTGDPKSSLWGIKNPSTIFRFFEIDAKYFSAHVDEVKQLNRIEMFFSIIKKNYELAAYVLENGIDEDLGGYLGLSSNVKALNKQTHKSKSSASQLERHCLDRYDQAISQGWS